MGQPPDLTPEQIEKNKEDGQCLLFILMPIVLLGGFCLLGMLVKFFRWAFL